MARPTPIERDLREQALRMACDTNNSGVDNADSIVERAQAFYEFLSGDQ